MRCWPISCSKPCAYDSSPPCCEFEHNLQSTLTWKPRDKWFTWVKAPGQGSSYGSVNLAFVLSSHLLGILKLKIKMSKCRK